ncbi:hypothetical protein [Desulfosarcina alkanivorans]|uniref:hypothetical protein n=1 Tax=Desulfosarcina alkanivorans TaxID=571177 RepID=UPI0012D369E7|nr:hypothetical protein [Desulfosarcina alkanivorans]
MDIVLEQFAFAGIGVSPARHHFPGVGQFPQSVVAQPPEGIFGMMAFSRRPEPLKQFAQIPVDIR